jgi:hypothetical protein
MLSLSQTCAYRPPGGTQPERGDRGRSEVSGAFEIRVQEPAFEAPVRLDSRLPALAEVMLDGIVEPDFVKQPEVTFEFLARNWVLSRPPRIKTELANLDWDCGSPLSCLGISAIIMEHAGDTCVDEERCIF